MELLISQVLQPINYRYLVSRCIDWVDMPTNMFIRITMYYAFPWRVDNQGRKSRSYGWLCSLRVSLKNEIS
jgi:hypothetical protein